MLVRTTMFTPPSVALSDDWAVYPVDVVTLDGHWCVSYRMS
jgi:hypothetical protein